LNTLISVAYFHIYDDRRPEDNLAWSKYFAEKPFSLSSAGGIYFLYIIPQLAVHGTITTNLQGYITTQGIIKL